MNRLESAYAAELECRKLSGEIEHYAFECVKLRLADMTYLMPDFIVLMKNGLIEIHDVKGSFFPEHNRVKWKVAVDQYPWFIWVLVRRKNGMFEFERFE